MRNFKFFILPLIIIATFCLNSCGEIEPLDGDLIKENPDPETAGIFKVDFDGKTFVATAVEASVSDSYIAISGIKTSTGELVQIALPAPYTKVGTYTWNSMSAAGGIMILTYISSDATDAFTSAPKDSGGASDFPEYIDTATITISKIDVTNKKISGTFQFTGVRFKDQAETTVETKVFTNGSFTDISFTNDPASPDTDTFYAKLDGTEFVEDDIDVADVASSGVAPYYSIVAKKANDDSIGLSIAESLSVGTYEFTGDFGASVGANCLIGNVIYRANSGSLTITSKTATHIAGTFDVVIKNFTSGDTKTISAGTFSVDLP